MCIQVFTSTIGCVSWNVIVAGSYHALMVCNLVVYFHEVSNWLGVPPGVCHRSWSLPCADGL